MLCAVKPPATSLVLCLTLPILGCGAADPTAQAPASPLALTTTPTPTPTPTPTRPQVKNDDFLYLEEVTGERALAFARAHDAISEKTLTSDPGFHALEDRLLAIYGSKDRIPGPHMENGSLRNF